VEVRYRVLMLLVVGLTGVPASAGKDSSNECKSLKAKFAEFGIDVEKYRDVKRDAVADFAADVGTCPKEALAALKVDGGANYVCSKLWSTYLDPKHAASIRYAAGEACGYLNVPKSGDYNGGSTSAGIPGALESLRKRKDLRASTAEWEKGNNGRKVDLNRIDISKPYSAEMNFKYPNFKGDLKVEAQEKRKKFLQEKVLEILVSTKSMAADHAELQKIVDDKVPLLVPEEKSNALSEAFDKQLELFDLMNPGEDRSREREGMTRAKGLDEIQATEIFDIRGLEEQDKTSTTSRFRELLKNKEERAKVMAVLIVMNTKLEPKRISPEEVAIKIKIDFPAIFKAYPWRDISEYLEK
jgi:hypothetical protein